MCSLGQTTLKLVPILIPYHICMYGERESGEQDSGERERERGRHRTERGRKRKWLIIWKEIRILA